MAFKKTNEGRVFFQGSNSAGANDGPRSPAAAKTATSQQQQQARKGELPEPGSAHTSSAPTQLQILALLRSLNDKLKATQVERNSMRSELENYRRTMDSLADKAHRGERAEKLAQETMRELTETRKLLLDLEGRQAEIEKDSKASSEKIRVGVGSYRDLVKRLETTEQKQEEIGRKVDETITQQQRVMRQVEKAIEDRTRVMRKIERIEETVIQTRDALNAKAMVLLTDQNIAGSAAADLDDDIFKTQQEPGIPAALPDDEINAEPWTTARSLQAAAILLLVVGGILAGWAVSEMRRAPVGNAGEFQITESAPAQTPQEAESARIAAAAASPEEQEKADAIVNKWKVSEDTSAYSDNSDRSAAPAETASAAIEQKPDPSNDIGAVDVNDTAKLQKMLESDPDKVATALNNIEPSDEGTPPPSDVATDSTQVASLTPATVPVEETNNIEQDEPQAEAAPVPATLVYKRSNVDVRTLIKPDSSLPDPVKKIEDQAFDGVPEAQHDLAAIYTAGHGGVTQDFKRAFFWFEQAANAGVANAAYNLGVLYHQGLGTKADIKKAIEWYTKAADLGHPEAQYNLGIAYIEGVGVPYDPFKANAYFEKAANQGIMEAAYNLGLIYENGLLGKPEPDQALVWYKDAADKGSPEAKAALEQLAKTLNIKMEDINTLVDSVKTAHQGQPPVAAVAPVQKQSAGRAAEGNQTAILAQIQDHLMSLGLYPGPADGTDSPLSQDAIRAYQQLNNLPATGRATPDLLVRMMGDEEGKAPGKTANGYN